jgi:hypothetical protein
VTAYRFKIFLERRLFVTWSLLAFSVPTAQLPTITYPNPASVLGWTLNFSTNLQLQPDPSPGMPMAACMARFYLSQSLMPNRLFLQIIDIHLFRHYKYALTASYVSIISALSCEI